MDQGIKMYSSSVLTELMYENVLDAKPETVSSVVGFIVNHAHVFPQLVDLLLFCFGGHIARTHTDL